MKIIEQLETILDKRNEYVLSLYEQKVNQQEQLENLKGEFEILQSKMILSPSTKLKDKLNEKRKEVKECEEQLQNIEKDINEFENTVFDLAPYRESIIKEFNEDAKTNISEQIERLKQAKKDYEDAAAKLTDSVQQNRQLMSKVHLVLMKTKQNLEGTQLVMGKGEDGYFAINLRNQKVNEYQNNEMQRIQAQLHAFPLLSFSVEREDLEPKSVYHYDFLGTLI